jgi:hypothetical protein
VALRSLPDDLLERADLWRGRQHARIEAEPSGHATLDECLPGGGWPRGALSEILLPRVGSGEWPLLWPALARLSSSGKRIALVSPPLLPYAPALANAGLALERCWIIDSRNPADTVWALEQCLRCTGVGAVVGWLDQADERTQRRLQLAAEQGSSRPLGLLLRPSEASRQSSVAALRLALSLSADGIAVDLLKVRGGRSGQRVTVAAA